MKLEQEIEALRKEVLAARAMRQEMWPSQSGTHSVLTSDLDAYDLIRKENMEAGL